MFEELNDLPQELEILRLQPKYCIREHNGRWYVVGHNQLVILDDENEASNLLQKLNEGEI